MSYARQMLAASASRVPDTDLDALATCVEALFDTAQATTTCADACLREQDVNKLARCIRLNTHCADVTLVAGRLLSRQEMPELAREIVEAAGLASRLCAEECEKHAGHMEHCRVCAEACRRSEEACNRLLAALPA